MTHSIEGPREASCGIEQADQRHAWSIETQTSRDRERETRSGPISTITRRAVFVCSEEHIGSTHVDPQAPLEVEEEGHCKPTWSAYCAFRHRVCEGEQQPSAATRAAVRDRVLARHRLRLGDIVDHAIAGARVAVD